MKTVGDKLHHGKGVSLGTLWGVYFILMALLGVTIGISFLAIGWLGRLSALLVACIKAALVGWYFMHLREAPKMAWVFLGASVFMLGVAALLSLADYLTRS